MAKTKRIEIRLPADHPVFKLPWGQRAGIIVKMLDQAAWSDERFNALESKIDSLEAQVARLIKLVERLEQETAGRPAEKPAPQRTTRGTRFDPQALLAGLFGPQKGGAQQP